MPRNGAIFLEKERHFLPWNPWEINHKNNN